MITVNGPNGVTINFPEGTDAATIESVMQQAIGGGGSPTPTADRFDLGSVKNDPDLKAGLERRAAEMRGPEPSPVLDSLATGIGGLIEGIPIAGPIIRGGVERAAAGTLAAVSDKSYGEVLDLIQQDKARMKQEHPVLDTASQVVGAVGSMLPVAATATGAKALGIVGGGLGSRSAAGLASGTAIGGADALVRSGGDLGEAGQGSAIGGAIGGLAPGVGAGIGALARGVKAAASPATQTIVNRVRPEGQAAELAAKAFQRDAIPLEEAGRRLEAMRLTHADAVLTDVGGANVRGLARAAVNTPGPQREAVQSFIEARNLAQPQRVTEFVGEVLKSPDDFAKTASRMAAERERIAGPIYEQAFASAKPVNVSGIVQYIDSKIMPGATNLMSPVADLRPDGVTATIGKLRSFFATSTNQRFDIRQLHQIKQELDGMIGTAKRAGDDTKARAILGVQNRLVQAMDRASPLYQKARGIYSNTFELEEALEVGRNILRMKPDQAREAFGSMTPAQKELAQVGMARAIADRVASMRDGHDVVKTIFGTPAIRDTLKAAFPSSEAYRKFQLAMMREARMRKTADAVRGNSTTIAQAADLIDTRSGRSVGGDVLSLLMDGQFKEAAGSAVRQVLKGETGLSEKVAENLGNMLLSTDPQKVQNAIKVLSRRQDALQRLHQRLTTISNAGAAAGGQVLQVPYRSSLD